MQPLINLKKFLAVLFLLIIPATLLTAYFRNFQPESGNNKSTGASGHHQTTMTGTSATGENSKNPGSSPEQPTMNTEMDHSKMGGNAKPEMSKSAPDESQLEASRAQLEASRLQLEASRKALEVTEPQPQSITVSPKGTAKEEGHAH